MIGWLEGIIVERSVPGKLVLNVNGVGYDIETSLQTFFQLEQSKDKVELHIHTVVREDAFLLYGFLSQKERALFRAFIKVSGIGPKIAIGILSSAELDTLIQGIQEQDAAFLVKLPGIGKKTAERLLIEMRDSVKELWVDSLKVKAPYEKHSRVMQSEAIHALESLGYKTQEAHQMIKKLDDGEKSSEQLIREALRAFAAG